MKKLVLLTLFPLFYLSGTSMNKTIEWYNAHAQNFYESTKDSDLQSGYTELLPLLSPAAHILDAGCGSGRDSKYFLAQGYTVTAFDGSAQLVTLAKEYTGLPVLNMKFQDLDFKEQFDAVWAAASLIHVSYQETRAVYEKIHATLKPGGFFFATYLYGNEHIPYEGRDFYCMDEATLPTYLDGLFEPVKLWKVSGKGGPFKHQNHTWLYFIVRKK